MIRSILLISAACLAIAAGAALAQEATADSVETATEQEAAITLPIPVWLQLGPFATPWPTFHEAKDKGFKAKDLLQSGSLDLRLLTPRESQSLALPGGGEATWRTVEPPGGLLPLTREKTGPAELYLAAYLQTDRWLSVTLRVSTAHLVQATLDGETVKLTKDEPAGTAVSDDDPGAGDPRQSGTLQLPLGKHLLILHAVLDPDILANWQLACELELAAEVAGEALAVTTDPVRAVTIHDILDAPRIESAVISADGKLAAVGLSEYGPDGEQDRWLEIRDTDKGKLRHSWRGGLNCSRIQWAPLGQRLSYTTSREGKTTLWIHDLADGSTTALLRDIDDFGSYGWAPDGSFLIYSFTIEAEPDERQVKRLQTLPDRQPRWRNRSYLVQAAVPGGARRRLTAGPLSTSGWSISGDSRRVLFFRHQPDMSGRPFSRTELWQLDLATLQAEKLLEDPWIQDAVYGPDLQKIAVQGSPSAFGGLGLAVPDGTTPNDYGGQLYIYDLQSGEAEAVSRAFDPAVSSMVWSRRDGRIYASCVDGQYGFLYAYDPRQQEWSRLDADLEVIDSFDVATDARMAIAYGTGATLPNRLTAIDLGKNKSRLLLDPGAERYRDIAFGKVEPWVCTLENGDKLDGRVYYPPNFDPDKSYPCIVYYYGGTYPVTRDYGGRYPKNIWAGQGYVVYVPEPSGAIGYGQEFAARHVNDWGKITAREVIQGTEAFLGAHPFVDPGRVGCIGASYGGFLTMYLVTQTDMFAAAISHAGISAITSYWGEGFWGYAYGARALAHSFPWSDRDLFIDQSPLYHADRIHTPLLLLHGADDTNVPAGESDQLFTALKLLGREVEYVRIEGQDHWILDRDRRIVWNDTILAFFAKHLKDRPQWWEKLYPDAAAQ